MLRTFLLLAIAGTATAAFAGLICVLLWSFFWHAVAWAVFVVAVFVIFTIAVYWCDDQVTAWQKAARKAGVS